MSDNTVVTAGYPAEAPPMFRDKKAVARFLLAAYAAPWMADVRSLSGTEWLIYVQILSILWSTGIVVLALSIFQRRVTDLGAFAGNGFNLAVSICFVSVAMLSGFLEHNESFKVFAFAIPTVLFIYSLILISTIAQSGLEPEDVLGTVVTIAIVTVILRVPLVSILFGLDVEKVRFTILCGAMSVNISYLVARAPAGLTWSEVGLALFQAAILVLAVTRIEIVAIFGISLALYLAGYRRRVGLKTIFAGIAALPVLLVAIYAVAVVLPGHQLARWTARTSEAQSSGGNLSGLERISQIVFEVQKLDGAGIEKFIGFGIAAPGGNYAPFEAFEASRGNLNIYTPTGFADHTYICLIFLGGLLGGGPLLFAQLIWFRNAFRGIAFVVRRYPKQLRWMAFAPLAVIGSQITNITSASFADRQASVYFGLCLGITGWFMAMRRRESRKSPKLGRTMQRQG